MKLSQYAKPAMALVRDVPGREAAMAGMILMAVSALSACHPDSRIVADLEYGAPSVELKVHYSQEPAGSIGQATQPDADPMN